MPLSLIGAMLLSTRFLACALFGSYACTASALPSVTWMIDETITRSESSLFWTSPTAIDLGLAEYNYDYQITRVTAFALGQSVDVTDQIGESFGLAGMGSTETLPVVLVDEALSEPTTGTSADIFIEVDENGLGQAAFTEVMLGQVPIGPLRFNIDSIRFEGEISIEGVAAIDPADFNADGTVDRTDYFLWRDNYGATDGTADGTADANEDGFADAIDYAIWRDRFDTPPAATAVPEPTAAGLALALGGLLLARRR